MIFNWHSVIVLFYILLISTLSIQAGLNLEEINSAYYNVTILNVPVLKSELSGNSITVVNKHGQEYKCEIPTIEIHNGEKKDEDNKEEIVNVSDLLKPMESAPCLVKRINWWTYEFCYGSTIKQYHVEDHKVIGPIMILGQYESEYNWKNKSEAQNKLQKYHTQLYVNGTRCDITGELRRTEVRFQCDEGASDYIRNVDEPESCRYLIVIGTSRLCHHPFMKNRLKQTPYPISCAPSLTHEQHEKYLQSMKEKEEKLKLSLENKHNEIPESDDVTERTEDFTIVDLTGKKEQLDKPKDLINEIKLNSPSEPNPEVVIPTPVSESDTSPTATESIDQTTTNVENDYIEVINKHSGKIAEELMKKFMDARKEFSNSADLVDKILGNSIDEEDTVLKIKKLQKKLQESVKDKDVNQIAGIEKMLDLLNSAVVLAHTQTNKITKQVKQIESFLQRKISEINELLEKDSSKLAPGNEDNEFRKESLFLKHFGDEGKENKERYEEAENKGIFKEAVLDKNKKQKLEEKIKEKLQKSGIDVGQKIEVKIITPNYMTEDHDDELIPTDDKESLKTIIFNFLAANEEEQVERVRHVNLVENYNFNINDVVDEKDDSNPSENDGNADEPSKP